MVSWLRKMVSTLAGLVGLEVLIARKRHNTDLVFVDRNAVEAFYHKDARVSLYYDGFDRTGMQGTDNYFKQCRSYRLQQLLEHVVALNLDGHVAECGCWRGHSSYIISTILAKSGFTGSFDIFDSFEGGLSAKGREDENVRISLSETEIEREKQIFASAEADLHRALASFDFYRLYKGWIPERFNEVEDKAYMFVHLDVDLYQPTLDGLEFFYPRLKKGGVIVVDDYGYTQFPGARKSVDEFVSRHEPAFFLAEASGGCFLIK